MPEDIREQITNLQKDVDARFDKVDVEITGLKVSMGKKVNWAWFFGASISLLSVLAIILGAMWTEIKSINENTRDTREAVARLEGKLEPFDFATE